jgi:hypothetical protein
MIPTVFGPSENDYEPTKMYIYIYILLDMSLDIWKVVQVYLHSAVDEDLTPIRKDSLNINELYDLSSSLDHPETKKVDKIIVSVLKSLIKSKLMS